MTPQNNAGGDIYLITPWQRLDRFFLLGSEHGTYYQRAQTLERENLANLHTCLDLDGPRVVQTILATSLQGRAPRQSPLIAALAIALKHSDLETRRAAEAALPKVCRTASHLFMLCERMKAYGGGWGRLTKRALTRWYQERPIENLQYQVIKYRQRHGWTHRDLLRKLHIPPASPKEQALFGWITTKTLAPNTGLEQLEAFEKIQYCTSATQAISLITQHDLPWEAVPTQWLREPSIWEALLPNMPMGATLRNLANLTRIGLLSPGSKATNMVVQRLGQKDRIQAARLHPLSILNALGVYSKGKSAHGRGGWAPVPEICAALDRAFYLSFDLLEPSEERTLIALDVSGSMSWGACAGMEGLTPREASAAMAMAILKCEERTMVMGFSDTFVPLPIHRTMRLPEVLEVVDGLPFSSTNCALPMIWANENKHKFDHFVVFTDNETWCGKLSASDALRRYRRDHVPEARLTVCAMTSTSFSIADPNDPGMLDICGVDSHLPQLLRK